MICQMEFECHHPQCKLLVPCENSCGSDEIVKVRSPVRLSRVLMMSKILIQITADLRKHQGLVVQSTISLLSSLVVKMLTVLKSTISNSQVFLLKKCE